MSIPTQTEMFSVVLSLMTDGKSRTRKETKDLVRKSLKLTRFECRQKTSGGVPVYESRVGWSVSHLSRAGYLKRVSRGVYRITPEGKEAIAKSKSADELYKSIQERISESDPWSGDGATGDASASRESGGSPVEAIDDAVRDLTGSLADELLEMVLSKEPAFFEKLVVDLLETMGYGVGKVTSYTNDGGIDGVITTDALGFDPIYTQAKRYSASRSVGRPEMQGFAGALGPITRGVFITTSSFNDGAVEFARAYPHATIVLIDGRKLVDLMIKYDLGVSTERVYEIKRIDIDYFEQE